MIKKIIKISTILLLLTSNCFAEISDVRENISVKNTTIWLNEQLFVNLEVQYSWNNESENQEVDEKNWWMVIELNTSEKEIDLGWIEKFDIIGQTKNQKIENINWKETTQITKTYTLKPKSVWEYKLWPISILGWPNPKKLTKSITITVQDQKEIQNTENKTQNEINIKQTNSPYLYVLVTILILLVLIYLYLWYLEKKEVNTKKNKKEEQKKEEKEDKDYLELLTKELDKYIEEKAWKKLEWLTIYEKLEFEKDEKTKKVLKTIYEKINEYKYSGKKIDKENLLEELKTLGWNIIKNIF